jgi:hypothetical protein
MNKLESIIQKRKDLLEMGIDENDPIFSAIESVFQDYLLEATSKLAQNEQFLGDLGRKSAKIEQNSDK